MKQLENKDMPEVAGGDVTSSTPLAEFINPILQIPDPIQPVNPLIIPEQPLP